MPVLSAKRAAALPDQRNDGSDAGSCQGGTITTRQSVEVSRHHPSTTAWMLLQRSAAISIIRVS